jgi:hypothetical protein
MLQMDLIMVIMLIQFFLIPMVFFMDQLLMVI